MKKKRAQALVELAIFGSLILMLLGILLSYGLRYGLQQKTMMHAFRKALELSGNETQGGQASYLYIQDRHLPNPSNPWAIGSVVPFYASATVIRSYNLTETPDFGKYEELPQLTIEIKGSQGSRIYTFKTAGFRKESINCLSLDKYYEVYGYLNVKGEGVEECKDMIKKLIDVPASQFGYDRESLYSDSHIQSYFKNNPRWITIIDPCEGELLNYEVCKRQCRLITDPTFCEKECELGKEKDSDKDCSLICQQKMDKIPWYCDKLDTIFNFAIAKNKPRTMGIQPDYKKETSINSQLTINQTGKVISTSDIINWKDTTRREIVYLEHLNTITGEAYPAVEANVKNKTDENVVEEFVIWNCADGICK
jgi:hypothetical protein